MAQTFLSDLINPEVMADFLDVKMIENIKLAPLCQINTSLQATAGDTISLPKYSYIGSASTIAEGGAITSVKLEATSTTVSVKKIVKNVDISDEALVSAYGNPIQEIERQLALSLADTVEADLFESIQGISESRVLDYSTDNESGFDALTPQAIDKSTISDAIMTLFGEDFATEQVYMLVSPFQYAQLRKDSDFVTIQNGDAVINGIVGQIYGVNLIVSNRVVLNTATTTADSFYYINPIVKAGGLSILLKRNTTIETDRNIATKVSTISADRHYTTYVANESKVGLIYFDKE
jgi:N4-gp56 family major capsid protein